MAKGPVLRCLAAITKDGSTTPKIYDAVADGDDYLIVLEWATVIGEEKGQYPKKRIRLPESRFQLAINPKFTFDLILIKSISLDTVPVEDTEMLSDELFRDPENLFFPGPNDD